MRLTIHLNNDSSLTKKWVSRSEMPKIRYTGAYVIETRLTGHTNSTRNRLSYSWDAVFLKTGMVNQSVLLSDVRECSICLEDDLELNELAITPCAHVFCVTCLRDSVRKDRKCALCREPVSENDVKPLVGEID